MSAVTKWEKIFRGGRVQKITPAVGKKCAAVILNWNGAALTKQCVDSLLAHGGPALAEIILVDNGSAAPEELEWALHCEKVRVIFSERNLGFAGGCNLGIQHASPQHDIWLLNNDTIIFPGALDALYGAFERAEVGASGSISNSVRPTQKIYPRLNTLEDMQSYVGQHASGYQLCVEEMRLSGFSMLIRREALESVGLLDTEFFPGGYEDDDYSLRLLEAGWKLEVCTGSMVYHIGSVTLKQVTGVSESFARGRQRLEQKWQVTEDDLFDDSRYYHLAPEEMRWQSVLEIGTHGGCWLKTVMVHGSPAVVDAIPRSRMNCRFLDPKIRCFDTLADITEQYDAVFCTDLPEETYTPAFFSHLGNLLRDGGRIYIRGHGAQYAAHLRETGAAGFRLFALDPGKIRDSVSRCGLEQEEVRANCKQRPDGSAYWQVIQICLRTKKG